MPDLVLRQLRYLLLRYLLLRCLLLRYLLLRCLLLRCLLLRCLLLRAGRRRVEPRVGGRSRPRVLGCGSVLTGDPLA